MTTFAFNLETPPIGFRENLAYIGKSTFFAGLAGMCMGYIYSKLADLPVKQAAQSYAIWFAAEAALIATASTFGSIISHNIAFRRGIQVTVLMVTSALGIEAMRKMGLMGNKLLACFLVGRAIHMTFLIINGRKGV